MGRVNKTRIRYGKLSDVIQKLNKKISIRVGILGENASTKVEGSDLTKAELGAVHEFGARITVTEKMRAFLHYMGIHLKKDTKEIEIPVRSFLREALLTSDGKKALQTWNVSDKEALVEYLNNDSALAEVLANAIGQKALDRVLNAFDTGGFGKWKPITEFTRRHRKGGADNPPLEDTGDDLKSAITFEVKEL